MDGPAAEIHAETGADGGDVPGAEQPDDLLQCRENLFPGHMKRGMLRSDVVRGDPGIPEVDGVEIHADGEGTDLPAEKLGGDGADQAGIQATREQKAQRSIGVQTLFDSGDETLPDAAAGGFQIIRKVFFHRREIGIADEFSVGIVVAGREGKNPLTEAEKVLRFTGEGDAAVGKITVIERADPDGVPGGDEPVVFSIVENQGKLGVQKTEHVQTVLTIEGQEQLTVGSALKPVAQRFKLPSLFPPAVELAVADDLVLPQRKRLHPFIVQAHDGQPVKTEESSAGGLDAGVIRTAAFGSVKVRPDLPGGIEIRQKTHHTTHKKAPPEKSQLPVPIQKDGQLRIRGATFFAAERGRSTGVQQPPAP